MRLSQSILCLAALLLLQACATHGKIDAKDAAAARGEVLFDAGWLFKAGEVAGGQEPALDAKTWEAVDLPHDFMIEGKGQADTPQADRETIFDPKSPAGHGGGFVNGGIGWYRKVLTVPTQARGKRISLRFDGAYMNSEVWVNGKSLGRRPYGFASFEYDLTPELHYGLQDNVIAVRVNVEQPCSRWYSGGGLYRHVWLKMTNPVHVAPWGTFVRAQDVSDAQATILCRTTLQNDGGAASEVELVTTIRDDAGTAVATETSKVLLPAGKKLDSEQTLKLANPRRWSLEDPFQYTVETLVKRGSKAIDLYKTPLGVRTIEFTVDNGFLLNGKRVQIKGVCLHHDQGALGAAAYDRAIERQIEIMRSMGCNAIRTSHNPPAPHLLDLCDKLGMLVMDEAFDEWKESKTKMGYGRFFDEWSERDLREFMRRDRNHPSIIQWSIGNEIREQKTPGSGAITERLMKIAHEEDPTRTATSAMNSIPDAIKNGFNKALDVQGVNYRTVQYQNLKGTAPLVASETSSDVSSRGEYLLEIVDGKVRIAPLKNNQVTSYDLYAPAWAISAEASCLAIKNAPWVAGEFVWTGFDYIGEPTPYKWPSVSSYFGIVDLCGFPKDRYYFYQSQWLSKPMVHILPHWNWPEEFKGKKIPVWCYSNADSVELFLNGRSLDTRDFASTTGLHLAWEVPYEPGTLKAVAKKNGRVVAEDVVVTAGKPDRILLETDRAQIAPDGQDLAYVTAKIVDAHGNICPNAANLIQFKLQGPGKIAGLANGDATNHEAFKGDRHTANHGLCLAIVQSGDQPGQMTLQASAEGLTGAKVAIESR